MATPIPTVPVVGVLGGDGVGHKAAESGLLVNWPMQATGLFTMQDPEQSASDIYNLPLRGPASLEHAHVPIPGAGPVITPANATTAGWPNDSGDVQLGRQASWFAGAENKARFAFMQANGIAATGAF